jgi:glutathione peroxidase
MRTLLALSVVLAVSASALAEDKKEKKVPAVLNHKMKGIDGKEIDLSKYQGKVIMFVNVASKCGYTKQYKELQAIYEKYEKEGFVVIGVPANEFGKQEPGTDEEIATFCSTKYKVTFPLTSKVVVKGKGMTPLYETLTKNKQTEGDVKWNFTKFVIGRNGEIVARFEPAVKPDDKKVITVIEEELKKKD